MSETVDVTIIGAGVVGLAIASEVASRKRSVFVLEKNRSFGQETSSRNSQVIHSGMYYPTGSLKARACVEGRELLYRICQDNNIIHKRLTKLVVATTDKEVSRLRALYQKGQENGVSGLRILTRGEMRSLEPSVNGVAALFVPDAGVLDVHGLMKYFIGVSRDKGSQIVYMSEVVGIEGLGDGFRISVLSGGSVFSFITRVLINAAGLASERIAAMAGIDCVRYGYKLHYCKGEYFSVSGKKGLSVSRLIYPVPTDALIGVGIHITLDLDGRMRLGPNAEYISRIDYVVTDRNKQMFYDGVKEMLPSLVVGDLEPEMAGIRPKLQGPEDDIRDFVISNEVDKGCPGLINLIGIESPGLTSSPSIAKVVKRMVDDML